MATYVVGDIQGCFKPLQCLLDSVAFDPARDRLWSVGDIVNRGPQSLETLRFLKQLGSSFRMVLGNHDLHLLAVAHGDKAIKKGDTLDDILIAPDRDELLDWLRHQPLLFIEDDYVLVHAGIPHIWSIEKTAALAREVERILHGDRCREFFQHMYGNTPDRWSESLRGMDRLRVITNYLTRMRILTADGTLDLHYKGSADNVPAGFRPWFNYYPVDATPQHQVLFGHWAALACQLNLPGMHALDSGCVWGKQLSMLRIDDQVRLQCDCHG